MRRSLVPAFTFASTVVMLAGGGCSRLSGLDDLKVVSCVGEGCSSDVDPRVQQLDGGTTGDDTSGDTTGTTTGGETSGGTTSGGTTSGTTTGGTTTGGTSTGGTTGGSDAGTPLVCPGTAGPAMVKAGTFCIDSTEVTVAQYQAFLDTHGATMLAADVPTSCAGKTKNHTPENWTTQTKYTSRPVTYVDWCDATAFCKWSGKRLCGAIGGGASQMGWAGDATKDQYYAACSGGGVKPYPYGATRQSGACNDPGLAGSSVVNVKSMTGCVGGYSGLYDMVGNAYEWIDACAANAGLSDSCYLRGGSAQYGGAAYATCAGYFNDYNVYRSDRYEDTGFRCCGP